MKMNEALGTQGRVEFIVTKTKPQIIPGKFITQNLGGQKIYESAEIVYNEEDLIYKEEIKNIILNAGKDRTLSSLTTGFIKTVCRMAIGDRGTIPSDSTVPKVPTADFTTLYNEVFRSDVDVVTLNIGTPNVHEVKFIKTFSAVDIPITAFSNQAKPMVNEVAIVMADLIGGAPLPRADVSAPATNLADEELFAMRTFKSVPFDAANDLSITIRYTIFIE
jgi:hypothetical protein